MGAVAAVYSARERIAERDQDPLILEDIQSQRLNRVSTFKRAGVSRSLFVTPPIVVLQEFEELGPKRPSSPADSDKDQGNKLTPEEYLENWIKNTGEKEISRREWVLKEIKEKCVEEKENVMHYKNLFGFLFFAALYLAILVCQRQSNPSFEISRLLYEYLPEKTNEGAVVQPFTGWGEVISYLNENIIQEVWKDSTCGDGSCVGPFEYISWGLESNLHGCRNDCGSIKELTNVAVHLDYTTASQGLLAAKLSLGAEGLETPQPVEWNVCTRRVNKLVEECWFSTVQTLQPGQEIKETLQLPDDQWYLKIDDDSRYLRGSLTAESPVGRSCTLNCSTAVCSYDCVEGGDAQGTKETSLFNFEMCAYNDHDDSALTWRDYEFDGPCEDYALRLSSYPVGHIQVSINQTWVEVCPWAIDFYVTHIAEINTICRNMGYDDGEGVEWTTSNRTKFFAGSCNALETPGFCTASDEQYRNLIITAGQCPWSYSVQCSGNKSPDTCKNGNADSSTLHISTLEPITKAWFDLGEEVEVGTGEDNTAGDSCAASDTTPPAAPAATDSDSVASGTCSTEPIPCIASLHFDTTRCLILYHHYAYTCSETVEDLVNQVGICASSATLESLLLDSGLTANTSIGEVCPEVCCSSLEECAGLGLLRLAGSSGPGRRTPYSWEGRLEVWTTDYSANYSGWTSVFASRDWQYESATMACQQMGYDSVLTSDLRLATTSKYVSSDVYKSYWPAEAGVNQQTGKTNSRLAVKRCAGTETSFLQCPMEDWWGFDTANHALKTNISDVFGVSQVFGTGNDITWWGFFESGVSVVNLQCHNASAAMPPIYEDVCAGGECCSPKCLSFKNPAYKWDTVECVYNDLECFDKQACRDENMCVGDIAMRANQVCNADCNNAACRMDDWDCCAPGEIFDRNSGFDQSCCQPTSFAPGNKYNFDLDAHPEIDYAATSKKWVRALNSNNLVAGMIIHQTRSFLSKTSGPVNGSEYFTMSGTNLEMYGRNPYFLSTSPMYDPGLDETDYYTAEEAQAAGEEGCKAFTHYTMPGFRDGFPVVLSVELDENEVQELVKYMVQGSFVDQQTESLKAHLVFYNAPSGQFANLVLDFTMVNGGGIIFKYKVQPMDLGTYQSQADYIRLVAEIVFICMVMFSLFNESKDGYRAGFKVHFSSLWNTCDAISISLNLACAVIWIYMNWYSTYRLNIQNVYDIYPDPEKQRGRLIYDHDQLKELADQFTKVTQIGNMYSLYMSLCGINIMLFLLRIFKLLDFQPRVGILTRTIAKALDDLLHFAFVLVLTFIVYAILGFVIFGPTIQRFSTFIGSSSTVFNMMLGEFADAHEDLFDASVDSGLLIFPAYLFFYSFMCIVFLVMLNFLLAIIVDAFVDVKPKDGDDRASMFMELYKIAWNYAQFVVNKEESLKQLEVDLSDMHHKFTSIRTDSRKNSLLGASAWDLAGLEVQVPTEPAIVMHDETYLVKMNTQLLGSVLKQASSNLLKTPDRHGKTPERDDGICPRGFAERVITHFGRQIPMTETAKPILQTSQTEQIKELLERRTEYLARKVDKIEEVQKAMQTSHQETTEKLEQIISLLRKKHASSTPPSNGYFLSSYEEQ